MSAKEVEKGGMWFEPSNRVVVITYAKFGLLYERNFDFYKHFSYNIHCDLSLYVGNSRVLSC